MGTLATPKMTITFTKDVERRASTWEATLGKRTKVPGSTMALGRGDLPHDLTQLVVEAVERVDDGFWGLIARGATFRSTGRKRTRPGRAVIAENRAGLAAAEALVGDRVRRWLAGENSPVGEQLSRFDRLWRTLGDGASFTVAWPSLDLVDD